MSYIYKSIDEIDLNKVKVTSDPELSPYERETHYYINDDTDVAEIDSAQVVWMNYLLKHPHFTPDKDGILMINDKTIVGVKGKIPRNCVLLSTNPRKEFYKLKIGGK